VGKLSGAGEKAIELAARAGLELDPWQQYVLDTGLRRRGDGRWAAFEVALIVARQLPRMARARFWRRGSWRGCSWMSRTVSGMSG
jgi:hypothetical protein